MPVKTKLKLFFGLIITFVILYYSFEALKSLHPGGLFRSDISWGLVTISVIVYIYANYIRGLAYTRGIDRSMDRMTAFEIVGIGHAINMVLPLHAGEGLRAAFFPNEYSAARRTKLLIIPAFIDFVAIILISIPAVPFAGFKDQNLLRALWILSFCCIAAVILFAFLIFYVPRLRGYFSEFLNIDAIKMILWVILSWLILLISTWIGLIAFGFGTVASIRMSLAVFAATNVINFIPATPGAVGLFEYGTILGLGGLGIDRGTALSASLLLHLIQYIALLPLGVFLYMKALHGRYGEALKHIWRKKKKQTSLED